MAKILTHTMNEYSLEDAEKLVIFYTERVIGNPFGGHIETVVDSIFKEIQEDGSYVIYGRSKPIKEYINYIRNLEAIAETQGLLSPQQALTRADF